MYHDVVCAMTDAELMEAYASRGLEQAFRVLVERHYRMVYRACLRELRDPGAAEDAVQAVFMILARKAGKIGTKKSVAGWLFQTALFVVSNMKRAERRRRKREKEVGEVRTMGVREEGESLWERIAPLVNGAMARLGKKHREVVIRRFFEGKTYADLSRELGCSEDAAKQRVRYGLKKLRKILAAEGARVPGGMLAAALVKEQEAAVSVGLVEKCVHAGLTGSGVSGSIAEGAMKMMFWQTVKRYVTAGVLAVALAGGTGLVLTAADGGGGGKYRAVRGGGEGLPLGELRHDGPPTPEQISLYLPVTGALDTGAQARVQYRASGGKEWKEAHPLHRIRPEATTGRKPADAFAGVITGLEPGKSYEVKVTVTFGDASRTFLLKATTRSLPGPAGKPTKRVKAGSGAKQVQAVLDSAGPGDVVQFERGVYAVDGLQLKRSGTPEKPIYIRGESREGVVLKDPTGTILQILGVHDVVIENLTFEGSGTDSGTRSSSKGINFWNGADPQERITIRHNVFRGVDMGVIAWGDTKELLVYDNTLTGNNRWEKYFVNSNRTWNDDGIRVPGLGNAVFNNTLSGFGDSLAMENGFSNVGVHFYRNEVLMTGDDAFEGDYGVRNITFYDNRIYNSMTFVSFDPIYGGPAFVFRNICINTGRGPYKLNNKNTGFFIYNNTVIRTEGIASGGGWAWVQYDNGPLVAWGYRNNILIYYGGKKLMAMESSGQDPIDFDHNAWYPDGAVWWTHSGGSFRSMEQARSNLKPTTPVFGTCTRRHEEDVICGPQPFTEKIKLGANHLTKITTLYVPTPAADSPLRGTGVPIPGVTDGFEGKAPDRGAVITGRRLPVWGDRTGRGK